MTFKQILIVVRIQVDDTSEMPILIWFFGGAYFFGSKDQYGPAYLLDRDVILVTVNYRLGAFGKLCKIQIKAIPNHVELKYSFL